MVSIREVMQPEPITVREKDSLRDAVELLIDNSISGLGVVDDSGRVIGALTERDLLKLFYEKEPLTIASIMTRDPVVVSVDAPLVDVVDVLMANNFRRVFITDHERLVGLISRSDLMPAILEGLIERC